jgi:hypothetical protein
LSEDFLCGFAAKYIGSFPRSSLAASIAVVVAASSVEVSGDVEGCIDAAVDEMAFEAVGKDETGTVGQGILGTVGEEGPEATSDGCWGLDNFVLQYPPRPQKFVSG